jgi:hypothetical protein
MPLWVLHGTKPSEKLSRNYLVRAPGPLFVGLRRVPVKAIDEPGFGRTKG